MNDQAKICELREFLPRTWHVFLARFAAPSPVQQHGIPVILEDHATLLVAPTASGKTETFAAPIAERILDASPPKPLSAWIISPTRALVNDLTRRLANPLSKLKLDLARRTGEHRELKADKPPHLIITTPESFDSLLARSPSLFVGMEYLVLDEIHMLDFSTRGDQLACLISRVKNIAPGVQVIASSATIDNPEALARRYLGPSTRLVTVFGSRAIEPSFVQGGAGALARELRRLAAPRHGVRKVLAFVRRRADAERLSSVFKGRAPYGDAVFVHHGSLARRRREEVEHRMLAGSAGICFATSTLEVGIDIGDIDMVVLTSPPPDVSSFLQRIGRGNRRSAVTRVCCIADDGAQRLRYQHLIHSARLGRLLADPHHFCPSILVQQCLSLLKQSPGGWISKDAFISRMPGSLIHPRWLSRIDELFEHLSIRDWLIGKAGRYYPGAKLNQAFDAGRIHGNIADQTPKIDVVDRETRQVIGSVPRYAAADGKLLLGGRRLKACKSAGRSKMIVTETKKKADLKMPWTQPPITPFTLARDFAGFIDLPPDTALMLPLEHDTFALFHFLGSIWGELLNAVLGDLKETTIGSSNPFCTIVKGTSPRIPNEITEVEVRSVITANQNKLVTRIPFGPWFSELPETWQRDCLLERLQPELFVQIIRSLELHQASSSIQDESTLALLAMSRF